MCGRRLTGAVVARILEQQSDWEARRSPSYIHCYHFLALFNARALAPKAARFLQVFCPSSQRLPADYIYF
jgi:hypothetical protein